MSALALNEVPSPQLAPGDEVIDLDHLSRMTLGERSLEREVLALFARMRLQRSTLRWSRRRRQLQACCAHTRVCTQPH
jgi:hypothetical protein